MKDLELLHEKRFIFLDGKISIQYYEMPQEKLSLRDLSELFLGNNEFFPNMHSRAPGGDGFELYFYEPSGYEGLTFVQYYNLLRSPEMNKKLFDQPEISSPLRAAVRSTRDGVQMGLWLNTINRRPSEITLEWFVAQETEASASMLHYLIASSYQNGMIYPVTIEKQAPV